MLRRRLGDKVFWSAIENYIKEYSRKTVETYDFKRVLESHSSINLNRFFEEWLYSKGYPKLKFQLENSKLNVSQTQFDKILEIGYFQFDLDLVVTTKDEKKHNFILKMDSQNSCVTLDFLVDPNDVFMIEIDPLNKVLFGVDSLDGFSDQILSNTLENSPSIFNQVILFNFFSDY